MINIEKLREKAINYVAQGGYSAVQSLVDSLTEEQLENEFYFLDEEE